MCASNFGIIEKHVADIKLGKYFHLECTCLSVMLSKFVLGSCSGHAERELLITQIFTICEWLLFCPFLSCTTEQLAALAVCAYRSVHEGQIKYAAPKS